VTINGKATKSLLLIDETLDAATPFEGSVEVRRLFPHSVLLAEPGGTSHADSLSGDRCVDATIARYLEAGKLPGRHRGARWDKTCKPLPRPASEPDDGPARAVAARTGGPITYRDPAGRPVARRRSSVALGQRLVDFLALRADGEPLGIPARHPHLAAQRHHRATGYRTVDDLVFLDVVRKPLMIAIAVGEIRADVGILPGLAAGSSCAHNDRVYSASAGRGESAGAA
jgi:hypothetical protein